MTKLLIIYASDYGNTKKMANAAAEGSGTVEGVEVVMKPAEEITPADWTSSDGVLLGSPVHMGSVDWRIKKMIDTVCSGLWMQDAMNGKVGGVLTSGGGFGNGGGGTELTMLTMLSNFAELGMIIIPLPKMSQDYARGGLHWGPYGRSADEAGNHIGVSEAALSIARRHGIHMARATLALQGHNIFNE